MTVWNEQTRRRGRLALVYSGLGASVAIPIVVGMARNLSDAGNVAQIVSVPLAAISAAGLFLWPSRDGSGSPKTSTITSEGSPPAPHRSRARTVAGVFAVVFLAVAVANLVTGTILSAGRSHDLDGPHGPGGPRDHGGPPGPGRPPGPMAFGPPVAAERPVELSTKAGQESIEIAWMRQVADKSGDLQMDRSSIYTLLGASLAVIEDSPEPVHARCAEIQSWVTRVDFTSLHEGSQLCAQGHDGRYAMLKVRALPRSQGSNGRFIFYGKAWDSPF